MLLQGKPEEFGENVEGQLMNCLLSEGGKSSGAIQRQHKTSRALMDPPSRQAEKERLRILAAMEEEQRRRLLALLAEEDRRILMIDLQSKAAKAMVTDGQTDQTDDFLATWGLNAIEEVEEEELTTKLTSRASGTRARGGAVPSHHPKLRQSQGPAQTTRKTSILPPNTKPVMEAGMKPVTGSQAKTHANVPQATVSSFRDTVIQGTKMAHHERNPSSAA